MKIFRDTGLSKTQQSFVALPRELERDRRIVTLRPIGASPLLYDLFVWNQLNSRAGGSAVEGAELAANLPAYRRRRLGKFCMLCRIHKGFINIVRRSFKRNRLMKVFSLH